MGGKRRMKIAITGGAGFIGTNTCIEAVGRGHEVVAFDNFVRPLTENNIEVLKNQGVKIVRGDVRNFEDFEKLPWIPDAWIHLAGQCGIPYAQINPRYDFMVNTLGTINVLEYSRLHGKIPVAFASSNKAYTNLTNELEVDELKTRYQWNKTQLGYMDEDVSEIGVGEKFPLDAYGKYARSLYGTSKVSADLYCQEYYQAFDVPTVINRMSCIYGLFQLGIEDQGWVDFFIRKIQLGNGKINIFGSGKQVRDMLFGSDVARLYVDEIEQIDKVKGQTYNIGGGFDFTMSLLEAISFIEAETGKRAELNFTDKRHGDQDIWISDLTKIKKDLGWSPVISPQDGIRMIIDQYQNK